MGNTLATQNAVNKTARRETINKIITFMSLNILK